VLDRPLVVSLPNHTPSASAPRGYGRTGVARKPPGLFLH
jgi:hypothetical protein